MRKKQAADVNLKRVALWITGAYALLAVLLYILMGYQLHFRESRGNLAMPTAETGTVELVQGSAVEQRFSAKIQRLESVTVQWGTYYRPNAGTVTIELFNEADGTLLMSGSFDAAAIAEGGTTEINAEEPIETAYLAPLLLRITSDSQPGSAVSPLMSASAKEEGFSLNLNGAPTNGVLCFSASGEDYIWTGLHYWEFAAGFGLLLVLSELFIWNQHKKGKHSYVINALIAIKKYGFLIRQMVSRDFKLKYKRSILGVFWSFLNPLLTMAVQYAVFSSLFRFDIPYYPVYLITGIVLFNFFTEASNMSLTSILGNSGLITKVYVPKYIYPLTRVLSSLVNLVIALIPLLLVALFSGLLPTKAWLLLPFPLLCLTVFSLGFGLILASAMVFFRDVQFLWGVMNMIWMYMTPIFYPESILPKSVARVLEVNPLYYFISFARSCVINGVSPEPMAYVQCVGVALLMLLVGAFVFYKTQDKFVLYL